jgi:PAS domain S-box-containing protein
MRFAAPPAAVPRWVRALQGVAALTILGYLSWTLPGVRRAPGFNALLDGALQGAGYVAVAVLCAVGATRGRRTSVAWWLVSAAIGLRAVGFVLSLSFLGLHHPLPYPSIADLAWVLSSLALIGAIAVRLHEVAPRLPVLAVLDGLIAVAIVLGVAVAVLADPIVTLSAPGMPRSEILVSIGYPVLDILQLVAASALVMAARMQMRRADVVLVCGLAAFTVVDVVYVVLLTEGRWRSGTLLASFSLVATAVIAGAVWWAPARTTPTPRRVGDPPVVTAAPGIALPATLAALAVIALGVAGAVDAAPIALLAFAVGIAVAIVRGVLTIRGDRREAGLVLGAATEDLRRFHALVEASTDFIGVADARGNVLYINPGGRRMLGVRPDQDVTAMTVAQIVSHEGSGGFAARWPMLLDNGTWSGESDLVPVDGTDPIPVAVSTFVINDPVTYEPFAIATIQRDIGEQRRAEAARRDLSEQRARLLTRLVQAQEDERARIAADVHDDSVQALAAVELRLAALRRRLTEQAPDLVQSVAVVQDTITAATGRLRDLLFDLESPVHRAGLEEALAQAAQFVFSGTGVRWQLTGDTDIALSEPDLVTAYRIAKEAMINVRKHAAAHHVVIDVQRGRDHVCVLVRDDGRGIRPEADRDRPGHRGLATMRDRARLAGGELTVRPLDAGGTEVRLTLPFDVGLPREP